MDVIYFIIDNENKTFTIQIPSIPSYFMDEKMSFEYVAEVFHNYVYNNGETIWWESIINDIVNGRLFRVRPDLQVRFKRDTFKCISIQGL